MTNLAIKPATTPNDGHAPSRRHLLRLAGGASLVPLLAACADTGIAQSTGRNKPHTAVLLPMTGSAAGVATMMRNSMELAGTLGLTYYDTGAGKKSAIAAANRAVVAGADLILGPLYASQTKAVLGVVPREVPVISFTNDTALTNDGAFVTGVTPFQSTKSILGFASKQGLQAVALVAPNNAFGKRVEQALRAVAPRLGLRIGASVSDNLSQTDLAGDLRSAMNGRLPDAVYVPAVSRGAVPAATASVDLGITSLGSVQWNGIAESHFSGLDGSFFASPDPGAFRAYQLKYLDLHKEGAGVLAALAYDCAKLVAELRATRQPLRRTLLRPTGFDGVLGPYKFAANGASTRGLAVLQITDGQLWPVSSASL